jgi:hypothetical protein
VDGAGLVTIASAHPVSRTIDRLAAGSARVTGVATAG